MAKYKSKIANRDIIDLVDKAGLAIRDNEVFNIAKDIFEMEDDTVDRYPFKDMLELRDFIIEKKENIDNEKLLLCSLKNLKRMINSHKIKPVSQETYVGYCVNFETTKKILDNSKAELPILNYSGEEYVDIDSFYTLNDVLDRDDSNNELKLNNAEIIRKLKEEDILDYMQSLLSDNDFAEFICYYPGNGNVFNYYAQFNTERYMRNSGIEKNTEEYKKERVFKLLDYYEKIMEKFPEKFDMDKFIMVSAYRAKRLCENNPKEINKKTVASILHAANKYITDPKLKISGKMQLTIRDKVDYIEYSYKELQKDIEKIYDDQYYSVKEISEIKKDIIDSGEPIGRDFPIDFFEFLDFSEKDKKKLIQCNKENLEFLICNGQLSEEEIKEYVKDLGDYKLKYLGLEQLYDRALIYKEDLLRFYINGNIDLNKILDLDENYDMKPMISSEKLVEYYRKMQENPENEKQFNRYALLFRELNIKGKNGDAIVYISDQIMEELYKRDTDYEQDMKALYESDLLPIRTLIDYNGNEIIYDLMRNKSLRPKDAKELLMTGELDIKKTFNVLKNSDWSDAEKMNFIYSSFDGVGNSKEEIEIQNQARMYLIQAINISKEFNGFDDDGITGERRKRGERVEKCNRYITDPVYRWQLFSEIDKDVKTDAYSDGTVIFTLPNVNKGTVVIEKLFKKTKQGVKPNYGSATYIMSQEEFLNKKSEIIYGGLINRKVLIEMYSDGIIDKKSHSAGWGKKIKESIDISLENNYSKEKIEKIDSLVDRIEKARELVN